MVVGVCRNSSGVVSQTFHSLRGHALLTNAHWFVVESNSEDLTYLELQELATKYPQFTYQSLPHDGEESSRIDRIRRARNAYVYEIRRRRPRSVAVIDFDAKLIRSVSLPSGLSSVQVKNIVTARQTFCYYDVYAFEQLQAKSRLQEGVSKRASSGGAWHWLLVVIPSQIRLTWIARRGLEVRSAFGGFAIYPGEVFRTADYSSDKGSNFECEHLSLHEKAREQGYRIFIDPSIVYGRANEHSFPCVIIATLARFFGARSPAA